MVVSDEYIEKYSWMVRPCNIYKEEYSDCTSIRSRIHQHFVHGKLEDCNLWNRDYVNCNNWEEKQDRKAFKELIVSEEKRREMRLSAHNANDTWEPRNGPPTDWNSPLPKHIQERINNSYLKFKSEEIKEGTSQTTSSICVIS